jgi:hypothetical protein
MALKWHREAVWRRAGDPDIFGPGIGKEQPRTGHITHEPGRV